MRTVKFSDYEKKGQQTNIGRSHHQNDFRFGIGRENTIRPSGRTFFLNDWKTDHEIRRVRKSDQTDCLRSVKFACVKK